MISNKGREVRRGRAPKLPKNIERLYKQGKCREFSVVVARMDFAKILGKFTKVKIQYESSSTSTPKEKQNVQFSTPNSNSRLKNNENGMVLIHRSAYNQHPVKELLNSKKPTITEISSPRPVNNVLKENNRLKRVSFAKEKISSCSKKTEDNLSVKQYGIIFVAPTSKNNNNNDIKNVSLTDILPNIDNSILPSEDWCIEYFPKNEDPKEDKVYDRIAAELEDLMYNEKTAVKPESKSEGTDNKVDEFPSIMDILNDNSSENVPKSNHQSSPVESNLESHDVEAMLLGKSDQDNKDFEHMEVDNTMSDTPMDVDNSISNLIEDVSQLNETQAVSTEGDKSKDDIQNPQSPSILGQTLDKGNNENLSLENKQNNSSEDNQKVTIDREDENKHKITLGSEKSIDTEKKIDSKFIKMVDHKPDVTHVVFRNTKNGTCCKTVTCPRNLKYSVELEGKSVEFLGAPKYISSLEDLKVLLQIVNETELGNLYVLY